MSCGEERHVTPLFSLLTFAGFVVAGMLGALTGLGGDVVLVPLLTLIFHVDIRYAIGASLISVIATSSGAAAAYVREGYSNVRIGMFLKGAITLGHCSGHLLPHGFRPKRWVSPSASCCCFQPGLDEKRITKTKLEGELVVRQAATLRLLPRW